MSKELVVSKNDLPTIIPFVPLEASPILPGLVASLHVPQGKSYFAIEEAHRKRNVIGLLLPKAPLKALPSPNQSTDETEIDYKFSDLHRKGVSARIVKRIKMPDDSMNVLVQGISRFEVDKVVQSEPFLCGSVEYFHDKENKDIEQEALARSVIKQVKELSESNPYFTEEMKIAMVNAPFPGALADIVAFTLGLHGLEAQRFIESVDPRERLVRLLTLLRREHSLSKIQDRIRDEVDSRVEKVQREFVLREQLKSIKKELGEDVDEKSKDTRRLKKRLIEAKLPKHAIKVAKEELRRLQSIPEVSPEYNLTRSYLEWIADLPWSKRSKEKQNLKTAKSVLNKGHFGLEDVKNRILEFLAVRKLNPQFSGTILCFVGPPGVGKTSLGKSIAEATGRNFVRFSLGGMRDEAEIKGHRRTYVGAMPGKILQGLKRAGTRNALVMLDEIDKIGSSYHGDPASSLLEVLDPEQNSSFLDHYLDISFDLSDVMFIATANSLQTIPKALLDRLEVIELPGYTLEEKETIAKDFIIPRSQEKHGLKKNSFSLPLTTLRKIIHDYAREPGVRTLQQQIDRISRRTARQIVENPRKKSPTISSKNLDDWLGPQRFYNEVAERIDAPGTVVGLAWTSTGGEILFIEALALEGKGEVKLTGQMGDVMQESANIAFSHVKKYLSGLEGAAFYSLERDPETGKSRLISAQEWFKTHDVHLHIPAGAVPKDGPSAGITMASALLSLVTQRVARARTAMTGELSLTGKVLPVGGIKEKVLAAKRVGIKTLVLPELNRKDLKEIAKNQLTGLEFKFAKRVEEVFEFVLRR